MTVCTHFRTSNRSCIWSSLVCRIRCIFCEKIGDL